VVFDRSGSRRERLELNLRYEGGEFSCPTYPRLYACSFFHGSSSHVDVVKDWNRVQPVLERAVRKQRKERLVRERKAAVEYRYQVYENTLRPIDRSRLPSSHRAFAFKEIPALIDSDETPDFGALTPADWSRMVESWKEEEERRLYALLPDTETGLGPSPSTAGSLSRLDYAKFVFSCSACGVSFTGKDRCLNHACKDVRNWEHSNIELNSPRSSIAVSLLKFLQMDPNSTWEDVDYHDPRIYCVNCPLLLTPGSQTYTWRQFVRGDYIIRKSTTDSASQIDHIHASGHDDPEDWSCITDDDELSVIRRSENMSRSPRIQWFCNHCEQVDTKLELLCHLKER
jgi:hypothetical protein